MEEAKAIPVKMCILLRPEVDCKVCSPRILTYFCIERDSLGIFLGVQKAYALARSIKQAPPAY